MIQSLQSRNFLRGLAISSLSLLWITTALGLSTAPTDTEEQLRLQPILSNNLHKPIFLTHAGDRSGRLFLVEQDGKILILQKGRILPKPFLDISSNLSTGGERGLLGLTFHPEYPTNRRFFINYTRKQDGATVIAEYRVSSNPNQSENTGKKLLVMPQPYGNHNGGMVEFGPDGFLYIGMGDGGAGGDPENRGQNSQELLGKILRIDVNQGEKYGIPENNPFTKQGGRPEIYATGFEIPGDFPLTARQENSG